MDTFTAGDYCTHDVEDLDSEGEVDNVLSLLHAACNGDHDEMQDGERFRGTVERLLNEWCMQGKRQELERWHER